MSWKHSQWEETHGLRVLRLCGNPNDHHDGEHWPRIAMLDLSAEQFRQFSDDPLRFARIHNLYPEQPIRWIFGSAQLALGEGIPEAAPGARWVVMIHHARPSVAVYTACPQDFEEPSCELTTFE